MLRKFLLIAAFLLLARPALAEEKKDPKAGEGGHYLDLQVIALPIVINGRLLNYSFVHARINFVETADAPKLRQKEPFFRDILIRAAYRTPFNTAKDANKIDEARFKATLARLAATVTGPGVVRSVDLTSQTPLHQMRNPVG